MLNKLVNTAEIQHRALKLRIYPTKEQEILINKTFGCCRQIYNNRLFERNQFYENVIKPEADKKKQKELWKTAHFSSEKEMQENSPSLCVRWMCKKQRRNSRSTRRKRCTRR